MSDSFRRLSYRLLGLGFYAVLLAATLWVGFELGQRRASAFMLPASTALEAERAALIEERDGLRDALAAALRDRVISERSHQIDREAARVLQDQLRQAQDAELRLNKELSYLKQLVQEGGRGAIRAQDLRLDSEGRPGAFRYTFTVTQLVPGFGSSAGKVRFEVEGRDREGVAKLSLGDLPNAEPRELSVDLEHLQTLRGTFELPEDFEPTGILIGVEPSDEGLIPTSESFRWAPAGEEKEPAAVPDDAPRQGS
jgi:hypothetical protein